MTEGVRHSNPVIPEIVLSTFASIIKARCPACRKGPILRGVFGLHRRCAVCNYDFYPEPGFYLGAMMVSFLLTGLLTIPPMIALKVMEADLALLVAFPFIEFAFVGSFLLIYSRVVWLYIEHRMTAGLRDKDGEH